MRYQNIVSLQGDDYKRFEAMLYPETTAEDRRLGFLHGPTDIDGALDYLRMWEYGDGGDITPDEPGGPHRYQEDGYLMTWNTGLSWASLDRVIADDADGEDGDGGNPDPPLDVR